MLPLMTFIQTITANPRQRNQSRKRKKGIHICKEGIKFSVAADNMTLYIKNLEDATKMLLELIHNFSKVAEHKNQYTKMCPISTYEQQTIKREIQKKKCVYYSLENIIILRNKFNQQSKRPVHRKLRL